MKRLRFTWKRLIILSVLHGILLAMLSIYLQRLPWTVKGEDLLIQWSVILKRVVWHADKTHDHFLFVNTSYSNQLIDKYDDFGFPLGNEVITDRLQLAQFFNSLNRLDVHRGIIVDIFFEKQTESDEPLRTEIDQLDRAFLAAILNDKDSLQKPIFDHQYGLVTVETLDDIFLKYRLVWYDSLKVLPLKLQEMLHNHAYTRYGSFLRSYDQWFFNTFIPDMRMSQFDLTVERKFPLVNLSDLQFLDDEALRELVDDKIVVIGDFLANDNFETLTGQISGPLLLANIFLSLQMGDHELSLGFILFMIITFSIISFMVFIPESKVATKLTPGPLVKKR